MRVVYLHELADAPVPPFRRGEVGPVWIDARGELHAEAHLELSANSTHALLGHGVAGELDRLGLELGPLEAGRDALIPPGLLEEAIPLLYEADRKTYGGRFEFCVGRAEAPSPVEYRVRIDNREYQRTLARLQFLLTTASRHGWGVRLRL